MSMTEPIQVVDLEQLLPLAATEALREIPGKYAQPDPSKIAQLDKGGAKLDYEGHADITLDLIEVDPAWEIDIVRNTDGTWLVTKVEETGEAFIFGEMTILGVTRPCVGSVEAKGKYPIKELYKQLYSDLLRNGAMRFGFATKLWSKAERVEAGSSAASTTIPAEVAKALLNAARGIQDETVANNLRQKLGGFGSTAIQEIPVEYMPAVIAEVIGSVLEDARKIP